MAFRYYQDSTPSMKTLVINKLFKVLSQTNMNGSSKSATSYIGSDMSSLSAPQERQTIRHVAPLKACLHCGSYYLLPGSCHLCTYLPKSNGLLLGVPDPGLTAHTGKKRERGEEEEGKALGGQCSR